MSTEKHTTGSQNKIKDQEYERETHKLSGKYSLT